MVPPDAFPKPWNTINRYHRSSLLLCLPKIRPRVVLTYLEKVVFEEVPHGLVRRNAPEGVEVEVEDVEPKDEDEGGELRLVADGDGDHEDAADHVLNYHHGRRVEAQQGDEHEHEQDPARGIISRIFQIDREYEMCI